MENEGCIKFRYELSYLIRSSSAGLGDEKQKNCKVGRPLKYVGERIFVFGLEGSLRGLCRVNPVSASIKLMRSSPRFCWELQAQI